MNKSRIVSAASLVPLVLVLAACGSRQSEEPAAVEDPVSKEMATAMDKARGIEVTLQQQKDNLDRTLQENENPTAE